MEGCALHHIWHMPNVQVLNKIKYFHYEVSIRYHKDLSINGCRTLQILVSQKEEGSKDAEGYGARYWYFKGEHQPCAEADYWPGLRFHMTLASCIKFVNLENYKLYNFKI